jgi:hypothetical protein
MAEPASRPGPLDEEPPSLDPGAIERAYRRERTRRRARIERRESARTSNARFFFVIALLLFITVVIALSALRIVQKTFGV